MSNFFCECPDSGEPPCFGLVQLREQLAAAQEELERVRDKCNEHYMALAVAQSVERERCAKIVEQYSVEIEGMPRTSRSLKPLADIIRSGEND